MDNVRIYTSIINKRVLYWLCSIAAFISLDVFIRLKEYAEYIDSTVEISACDIIFLSVYGINNNDISINDLLRWLIPFILIIYFVSIFISTMAANKLKFTWLIRCKSYRSRIKIIYKSIMFLALVYTVFFFICISIFSAILSRNLNKTTEIFLSLNSDMKLGSIGMKYLTIQLILSFAAIMIILLIQCIISFFVKDEIKGEIIAICIMFVVGILGKFNVPNMFMLSRSSLVNGNINFSLECLLIMNIAIVILLSFVFIKLNDHSRKEL